MSPAVSRIRARGTHRLLSARHRPSPLADLADDEAEQSELAELEGATSDRVRGEAGEMPPGLDHAELVWDVRHAGLIRAAFVYPPGYPYGGRFNGPDRGCWYAAFKRQTALAEKLFHLRVWLDEVGVTDQHFELDDWYADFDGEFHDLRGDERFVECLAPQSYRASQGLAASLLSAGSNGLVYPSVRSSGGTNIACFRPAHVRNVRKGPTLGVYFTANKQPVVQIERSK
jgi:hypothetical protein